MYSKKNAVGIGLIKSKIVVAILACKLYIGNVITNKKINLTIRIQEEHVTIEHGRKWKGKEIKTEKPTTW